MARLNGQPTALVPGKGMGTMSGEPMGTIEPSHTSDVETFGEPTGTIEPSLA